MKMTGMVMFSSFARKGHREVRQLLEKITGLRDPFLFKMRDLQQSMPIRTIMCRAENERMTMRENRNDVLE